jgi:hypothetical protein
VYGGKGGICIKIATKSTMSKFRWRLLKRHLINSALIVIQQCCGSDECTKAGVSRRNTLQGSSSAVFTSVVLRDADGNVVVPHSVGNGKADLYDVFLEDHGINKTSALQTRSTSGVPVYKIGHPAPSKQKRDCPDDADFEQDGDQYTKTGKAIRKAA